MTRSRLISNSISFQSKLDELQNKILINGDIKPRGRIVSMAEIESMILQIENKLDLISFKKDREGMTFKLNYHVRPRKMYESKINSKATMIVIKKVSMGWSIISATREIIHSQRVKFINPLDFYHIFNDFLISTDFI